MYSEHYEKWVKFYRSHPNYIPGLIFLNKIITLSGYVMYPFLIIFMFIKKDPRILSFILIPGIAFVAVSIFRKVYNQNRPYEDPEVNTLTRRDKEGQSFPSRHVFSYSLICSLLWNIFPVAGVIMFLLLFVLAYLRVILGVHYPKDVLVGAILGILSGLFTITVAQFF